MTYRYLPHTADIKVAIEAPTLEALFGDAVTVVRHLLVGRSPVASDSTAVASREPCRANTSTTHDTNRSPRSRP
jgi:SHS2 domain-containing protein